MPAMARFLLRWPSNCCRPFSYRNSRSAKPAGQMGGCKCEQGSFRTLTCIKAQKNLGGGMTGIQCTLGRESEETPRFYLEEGTAVSSHLSCAWSQCSSRSGKIIVRFVVPAMDDFRRHRKRLTFRKNSNANRIHLRLGRGGIGSSLR